MKAIDLAKYPGDLIDRIFNEIPHIRKSIEADPKQRNFFVNASRIFEVDPNETIIRRGEFDQWVYYLLAGQLLVYPEFIDRKSNLVSYISPGEMFGELSFIRELDRNATIIADPNSNRIICLGTDFSSFGKIDDFSKVPISTKITFYQVAIDIIRKRLESLRIDYPDNELAHKRTFFKAFNGPRGTMHELLYLNDQSKDYANILCKWNRSLEMDSNYHATKGRVPADLVDQLLKVED